MIALKRLERGEHATGYEKHEAKITPSRALNFKGK